MAHTASTNATTPMRATAIKVNQWTTGRPCRGVRTLALGKPRRSELKKLASISGFPRIDRAALRGGRSPLQTRAAGTQVGQVARSDWTPSSGRWAQLRRTERGTFGSMDDFEATWASFLGRLEE